MANVMIIHEPIWGNKREGEFWCMDVYIPNYVYSMTNCSYSKKDFWDYLNNSKEDNFFAIGRGLTPEEALSNWKKEAIRLEQFPAWIS